MTGLRGVLERQPPQRRAGRGRWWLTIALLVLGVTAVVVALTTSAGACARTWEHDDHAQALLVVGWCQSFSTYIGFPATFALGDVDTTMTMTGSELCGPDFLSLMPPDIGTLLRANGFTRFTCTGPRGEHADFAVPR